MESILRETLKVLSEHGKSGEDVLWCGNEEAQNEVQKSYKSFI